MDKKQVGFASMDSNKLRELASMGGKAGHVRGTAHEWTAEEAREAGRKGGIASHQNQRSAEADRQTIAGLLDVLASHGWSPSANVKNPTDDR
jgi:general stress protein YciG